MTNNWGDTGVALSSFFFSFLLFIFLFVVFFFPSRSLYEDAIGFEEVISGPSLVVTHLVETLRGRPWELDEKACEKSETRCPLSDSSCRILTESVIIPVLVSTE